MKKKFSENRFIIEQLEARLLFSADLGPVPFDEGMPLEESMSEIPVAEAGAGPGISGSRDAVGAEHLRHEIIFVDSGVTDYHQLVDDLLSKDYDKRRIEVVVLESGLDGIEQISETLAGYQDIDAVHLVSHGTDGAVQLGNTWLESDNINTYADLIEGWQSALTSRADLLFYGCDLASGEDGRALISNLAFLTGADIAASDNPTGRAVLGGDWVLEYSVGKIETETAVKLETETAWSGVLCVTNVGDGTEPSDKIVWETDNWAVSAFTLSSDNNSIVTGLTVAFSGTDPGDVKANGVKIYEDNGTTANEWDSSDTLISTASFSGNMADFTGFSIQLDAVPIQYLITYDISNGTTTGNTLQGAITGVTSTDLLQNSDDTDATLTIINNPPSATNLSAPEIYTEDTPLDLNDIVISDTDSANVTARLTLSDTAAGSLSTTTSGGVTSTFIDGVWTASGAIADVNTLLSGITFTPASNYNSSFTISTSVDDGKTALTGARNMTGIPVGDTPQVANIATIEDIQSRSIIIRRNASDGAEVTHFRISGIFNGTLYQADGVTQINDGDYITFAQAQAGLLFTPAGGPAVNGSFHVESSEDGLTVSLQSSTATSTVTVIPVNDIYNKNRPPAELPDISDIDPANEDEPAAGSPEYVTENKNSNQEKVAAQPIRMNITSFKKSPGPAVKDIDLSVSSRDPENSEYFGAAGNKSSAEYHNNFNSPIMSINNEGLDISNMEQDLNISLELVRNSVEAIERQENTITKTIMGATFSVSVGLATWALRTGSLLASAITSMPIWKGFDPLPVLPLSGKERRRKIREVRTIEKEERIKNKEVTDLLDDEKSGQLKDQDNNS